MAEDFFLCTQSVSGRLPGTTIPPPVCVLFLWEVYVIADIHTLEFFSPRTMTDMSTLSMKKKKKQRGKVLEMYRNRCPIMIPVSSDYTRAL